ncbi:MAG: hypothetical protein EXR62_15915 [Chloroflexi bacterium]|nr:hypothetical protein [Chloroflexota bacterium]
MPSPILGLLILLPLLGAIFSWFYAYLRGQSASRSITPVFIAVGDAAALVLGLAFTVWPPSPDKSVVGFDWLGWTTGSGKLVLSYTPLGIACLLLTATIILGTLLTLIDRKAPRALSPLSGSMLSLTVTLLFALFLSGNMLTAYLAFAGLEVAMAGLLWSIGHGEIRATGALRSLAAGGVAGVLLLAAAAAIGSRFPETWPALGSTVGTLALVAAWSLMGMYPLQAPLMWGIEYGSVGRLRILLGICGGMFLSLKVIMGLTASPTDAVLLATWASLALIISLLMALLSENVVRIWAWLAFGAAAGIVIMLTLGLPIAALLWGTGNLLGLGTLTLTLNGAPPVAGWRRLTWRTAQVIGLVALAAMPFTATFLGLWFALPVALTIHWINGLLLGAALALQTASVLHLYRRQQGLSKTGVLAPTGLGSLFGMLLMIMAALLAGVVPVLHIPILTDLYQSVALRGPVNPTGTYAIESLALCLLAWGIGWLIWRRRGSILSRRQRLWLIIQDLLMLGWLWQNITTGAKRIAEVLRRSTISIEGTNLLTWGIIWMILAALGLILVLQV